MKVKALKKFETIVDSTINRVRKDGEIFEADAQRVEQLLKAGVVEVLDKTEPKKVEEPEVHTEMQEPKEVKKAVRKSTKKKAVVEE